MSKGSCLWFTSTPPRPRPFRRPRSSNVHRCGRSRGTHKSLRHHSVPSARYASPTPHYITNSNPTVKTETVLSIISLQRLHRQHSPLEWLRSHLICKPYPGPSVEVIVSNGLGFAPVSRLTKSKWITTVNLWQTISFISFYKVFDFLDLLPIRNQNRRLRSLGFLPVLQ